MSYLQSDGHTNALAEPNSPTLSSVVTDTPTAISTPVLKKTRRVTREKREIPAKKEEAGAPLELEEKKVEAIAEEEEVMEEGVISEEVIGKRAIPVPIEKNKVFGRYAGQFGPFEMELRIDIDGFNPLQKVSGDYFLITGQTKSYFGSFLADSIYTTVANGIIQIYGTAKTSWTTSFTKLKITINQTSVFQPLPPALLQWYHASTNTPGALYVCNSTSRAFRTVQLEQDYVTGVTPFVSYNTASQPSGGPARVLSVNSAYQEAGIAMITAGLANAIPLNVAGVDAKWTNAELHNAMINHFSLYEEKPQWSVWLLHANEHIYGPGLLGIMFDQVGLQRQGCTVFYKGLDGATPDQQRLQLYTCVHELGHCFNLLHSWQKSLATPPKPNIADSFSWMNYPWLYPNGGASAFWNAFAFQFDPVEVSHLRHGFRNNVIMGGNPFTVGASLGDVAASFEDNIENYSNLVLQLEAKKTYMLGEPICLETKLKTTSMKNQSVTSNLHADFGFITIGIRKPGGEVLIYEPVAEMCVKPDYTVLNASNPGIYESSYIGFDKQGFIFDQIGNYQIRAVYYHRDGSRIVSDTLNIRVKSPVSAEDDEVADLMLSNDVGYLLSFMGSDAPYLRRGNDALELLADKYRDHPVAVYAQFIRGVNAQRTFKTIAPEKRVDIRQPDFQQGETMLKNTIERSKAGRGLDNISLNQAMQILAKSYLREGKIEAAEATVKDITEHFNSLPVKQHVKDTIARQANSILRSE